MVGRLSIFPSPVLVLLFGKDSDGDARLSRHHPCLGHPYMGVGKPGPPALPLCQSPGHPARSPRSAPVCAVPPHWLKLPNSSLPAWSRRHGARMLMGRLPHAKPFLFPAPLGSWRVRSGCVWVRMENPSQTTRLFITGCFEVFPLFSFCAALSVL